MEKDEIMKELKAIREDVKAIRNSMSPTPEEREAEMQQLPEGPPLSPEEKKEVEQALKEVAEGKTVPHEQVVRELKDKIHKEST